MVGMLQAPLGCQCSQLGDSRVEQIPCSVAESHELVFLGTLGLGTVTALTEWPAAHRRAAIAQGWGDARLVFIPASLVLTATATVDSVGAWKRRRRSRRLVATVVDQLWEKLWSASSELLLGLLGGLVLPGPTSVRWLWML